ncbi:MAG TPA: hypothetical protein VGC80_12900, partial [Acetobacteraceae bacterium]
DTPYWEIVLESRRLLFGQAVVLLLCWTSSAAMHRNSPILRHLMLALTVFSMAASVVFVMQGKNWFYHRLPAVMATMLALTLWLAFILGQIQTRWQRIDWRVPEMRRLLLPVPLALAALLDFGVDSVDRMRPWVAAAVEPSLSTEVKLERLIKKEKAKTYIAFSEWIALGFPVVNDTGVSWASRFDSMWALKGELWAARQAGGAPREWPIRDWVAKDFVAGCPDLAVVDVRGETNYVGVLINANPDFARAWSRYREIAAFDGLRVLKRNAVGCGPDPARPPGTGLKTLAME